MQVKVWRDDDTKRWRWVAVNRANEVIDGGEDYGSRRLAVRAADDYAAANGDLEVIVAEQP